MGHSGPILEALSLDLGLFLGVLGLIWAIWDYFEGSGPRFGPILGILGLIWTYFGASGPDLEVLGLDWLVFSIFGPGFGGFLAYLGLYWEFWA